MKAYFRRHSRQKIVAICLALAALYAVPFLTIPGNAAGYIKIDGIDGESTDPDHRDWIRIDSVQIGVARNISTGPAGERQISDPVIDDIVVVKELDKSTPKLFLEAVTGREGKNAEIHFTRDVGDTADGQEEVYLKFRLSDVLVSSLSTTASTGKVFPKVEIHLNYSKIEYEYIPYAPDGSALEPVKVSYDLLDREPVN